MKILALEFSSVERSVALVHGVAAGETQRATERIEKGGRSVQALGMIEAVLREAGTDRRQIEVLAIGLGPGSYTGIRAAIALAQGWSLVRDVQLLGISSAECLAAQAQAEGILGRVRVLIDAQRNEFYVESYEISARKILRTESLRLAARLEVEQFLKAGETIVGPEVTGGIAGVRWVYPRAAVLAELALQRTDFVCPEKLEPIYLREVSFVKSPAPGNLAI